MTPDAKLMLLIPLSEYLSRTYDPDCEYLEGELKERNVGEVGHSDAQSSVLLYVRTTARGFWAGVEVRVQVRPDRYRIPDVAVVCGAKPSVPVIVTPPDTVVEILSPDDRASDLQDKIDDYLAFGIPCVWIIRPETRRAWVHTSEGSREVKDGVLRNVAGDLKVPLAAIFE